MKRMFWMFLCISLLFLFSACKTDEPAAPTVQGGVTESQTEEASENNLSDATEAQNDTVTESESEQVTEDSVADTQVTEAMQTDVIASTELQTEQQITIQDDVIIAPAYNLEIPEDFEVKAESNDPLLENKQGTIQFNIMDKTRVVTDFEEYASDTYRTASASGFANGEMEDVTVNGIPMKRFAMSMIDDDGTALESYAYLAQVNNKVFMITLTSKDGGLADVSAADAFVAEIDFSA